MSEHKKQGRRFATFEITEADARLIPQMQPEHRAVITATGSYAEIAQALSLPVGTVKSRLYRARTELLGLRAGAGR